MDSSRTPHFPYLGDQIIPSQFPLLAKNIQKAINGDANAPRPSTSPRPPGPQQPLLGNRPPGAVSANRQTWLDSLTEIENVVTYSFHLEHWMTPNTLFK